MADSLSDRMKEFYEKVSRRSLLRRTPVIVRVDGRSFHTYTKGMDRPFAEPLWDSMESAALELAREMSGFKLGYVQSDEASFLLTDYDHELTEPWFGYCQNKLESISASIMTAAFNEVIPSDKSAHFDARAFNIPREDVANYFLWRAKDWERNSVTMLASCHYSHRELLEKSVADRHQMLFEKGVNWADLPDRYKNGCWLVKGEEGIYPNYSILPRYKSIVDWVTPWI